MTSATWPELLGRMRAYQESELLFTAVELEVFRHLSGSSRTAAELAEMARVSERGMGMLLDALVGLGLLSKHEGRYQGGAHVAALLDADSDESKLNAVRLLRAGRRQWSSLTDCVRRGGGVDTGRFASDAQANRDFIGAMHDMGFANGRAIAAHFDFSGCRRLLDVGGGPGSYSIAILQRHPHMRATVADLPLTLEVTRDYLQRYGMEARIDLCPLDAYAESDFALGNGFDIVLVSNLLHMAGPEENRKLIGRLATHLRAGGRILVHESFIDHDRPVAERALFALHMLVATEAGRCYSYEEVGDWLAAAGFSAIRPVEGVFALPSLLVAEKP